MSLLPALADIPLTTRDTFEARLQAVDANIRPFILRMYANPVLSRVQNL